MAIITSDTITLGNPTHPAGPKTEAGGIRILCGTNCILTGITIHSNTTATRARLFSESGDDPDQLLQTSAITALAATFNFGLISGRSYYVMVDNSGASFDVEKIDPDNEIVYNGTYISITAGRPNALPAGADTPTVTWNIKSITVGVELTGGRATRAIATRYPVEKGLTAGTTSQTGNVTNLVPANSNLTKNDKVGIT